MPEILTAGAASPHLPHSCACGVRWGGASTAHCAKCHHNFTGPSAFDRHRRGGTCLDPSSVGMVEKPRAYSCWGYEDERPERSYHADRDETWREDRYT